MAKFAALSAALGRGNTAVSVTVRCRELSSISSKRPRDPERRKGGLAQLVSKFHRPGENHLTGGYVVTDKTQSLLQEHLERTRGKVSRASSVLPLPWNTGCVCCFVMSA